MCQLPYLSPADYNLFLIKISLTLTLLLPHTCLLFWVHLYNIVIEIPKRNSTKPHEDSITLTLFKFEMRCKYSMKNNSHDFLSLIFGKILFMTVFMGILLLISFFFNIDLIDFIVMLCSNATLLFFWSLIVNCILYLFLPAKYKKYNAMFVFKLSILFLYTHY